MIANVPRAILSEADVDDLIGFWAAELTSAVDAVAHTSPGLSPSDVPGVDISQDDLDDLAVSVPTAGHAVTAYAVGVVAGAPTLTVLAARVERTRLLLILMGMFVIGHVLSALAGSMGLLIVARFLAGLPHGAFFGVGAVVGAAVAGPQNRGKAIGMMMAGLTIANMIGVPPVLPP